MKTLRLPFASVACIAVLAAPAALAQTPPAATAGNSITRSLNSMPPSAQPLVAPPSPPVAAPAAVTPAPVSPAPAPAPLPATPAPTPRPRDPIAEALAAPARATPAPVPTPAAPGPAPTPAPAGMTPPPAVARPATPAADAPLRPASSPPAFAPEPVPTAAPPVAAASPAVISPRPAAAPRPATPAPSPVAAPAPTTPATPVPAPSAAEPAPPVMTVLNPAAVAALPFTVDLPTGFQITTGRPGPDFRIYSIRRGQQTFVMVYAGPSSQFPIYSGERVEAGGRSSVVLTDGGQRRALEHMFQRATAPRELHVWVSTLDGADQALAETIAQSVDAK